MTDQHSPKHDPNKVDVVIAEGSEDGVIFQVHNEDGFVERETSLEDMPFWVRLHLEAYARKGMPLKDMENPSTGKESK